MSNHLSRREFAKAGAASAVAVSMPSTANVTRRSDKIRVGFIGVGNRGSQLMKAFATQEDCEFIGVADVYQPYRERARRNFGANLVAVEDYRKLLDRKDIDAIVIATPDHWHAIQAISAMSAGKDVYVEKPLSVTIHEGRQMVEAAKRYNRISQVGLHRRSMKLYRSLSDFVKTDQLGKVTVSRAYRLNNMFPDGIGQMPHQNPPSDLNWDLWLGPRPKQAYQENIAPYKFRWWQRFSSQMGNWGVHYFDTIRWMLGETAPSSVVAIGGNFAINDDRTIPDTAEAVFEMRGGSLLTFGQYEASSNPALAYGEIEFRGTQGTVYSSSTGYKVIAEKPGQFQAKGGRGKDFEFMLNEPNGVATANHARNFLDSVKSRKQTHCPMEEGHRSTTFAHLANISLATKSRLEWDSSNERFIDNELANELLHYEYRKGFELPI